VAGPEHIHCYALLQTPYSSKGFENMKEKESEKSVCWRGSAGPFVILNVAVSVCIEGRINPLIQN